MIKRLSVVAAAVLVLVLPGPPAVRAQGASYEFRGTVQSSERVFRNEVDLAVAGGIMAGRIRFIFDADAGGGQPACSGFESDFTGTPLQVTGTGVLGPVPVEQDDALHPCERGLDFDREPDTGELFASINGDVITGTLKFQPSRGTVQQIHNFRATRLGITTPSSRDLGTPAIGEFIDAAPLDDNTKTVLRGLENCQPHELVPGGRCAHYTQSVQNKRRDLIRKLGVPDGPLIEELLDIGTLADMKDPAGKPLVPSLQHRGLQQVIGRLASYPNGQGLDAMRRLVALTVAMNLEARR